MFNLDTSPKFRVNVRPAVPGSEDGSLDFSLIMSAVRSSDAAAASQALTEAVESGDAAVIAAAEIADLAALIHDWDGVVDAEGQKVPFSGEALARLLDLAVVRVAVYRAYVAALREAAAKN